MIEEVTWVDGEGGVPGFFIAVELGEWEAEEGVHEGEAGYGEA